MAHDDPTLEMPPEPDEMVGSGKLSDTSQYLGRMLGPYKVLEEIGRGGMGVVFRAWDPALDREVAVKLITPTLTQDDRKLARFLREARSVAKLNHPNIVPVYYAGTEEERTFIAMGLIRGEPLGDIIDREAPLPPRRAVRIVLEVAKALSHAHQLGIVHRDIKPDNIMITKAGEVRVMDFGLARNSTGLDEEGARITDTGIYIGTPEYSSPEQVETSQCDGRSDLYSLGVVFYEMLTGAVPHSASTPYQLFHQILKVEPEPVTQLNPLVPDPVAGVAEKLLAKDPADRYGTAGKLITDCESLLRVLDGSATVQPVDPAVRLPRSRRSSEARRRRKQVASRASILAAVLVAVIAVWALGLFDRLGPSPEPPPTTPDPSPLAETPTPEPVPDDPPPPARPTVLVRDFANQNHSESLAYLGPGIPMMLTTALAGSPFMDIVSVDRVSLAAAELEIQDLSDPRQMQRLVDYLGVTVVISGAFYSVGAAGADVRIVAQIVDYETGTAPGGISVTGPVNDIYPLLDQLAALVSQKLHDLYLPQEETSTGVSVDGGPTPVAMLDDAVEPGDVQLLLQDAVANLSTSPDARRGAAAEDSLGLPTVGSRPLEGGPPSGRRGGGKLDPRVARDVERSVGEIINRLTLEAMIERGWGGDDPDALAEMIDRLDPSQMSGLLGQAVQQLQREVAPNARRDSPPPHRVPMGDLGPVSIPDLERALHPRTELATMDRVLAEAQANFARGGEPLPQVSVPAEGTLPPAGGDTAPLTPNQLAEGQGCAWDDLDKETRERLQFAGRFHSMGMLHLQRAQDADTDADRSWQTRLAAQYFVQALCIEPRFAPARRELEQLRDNGWW